MIKLGRVSKETRGPVIPNYWEDLSEFRDGSIFRKTMG